LEASIVAAAVAAAVVLLLSFVAFALSRQVLLRVLTAAARRSRTTWDDALIDHKVFSRLSHLVPAAILHTTAPLVFRDFPQAVSGTQTLALVYMAFVGLAVTDALLNAISAIYGTFPVSAKIQIKPIVQVLKIVVYFSVGISVLAILLGQSPLVFFGGMGAFTAVLLLIFRDPILGLVAGIQLMSNQMVRVGDWIELPKHHADGDVIDVSLTTVKIQNWDKTISTIPTYSLVSESFRNWRGMSESGGRRIKRAVSIDVTSIAFCDAEMLERFQRIQFIAEYIERKRAEVELHNREAKVDTTLLVNGRHLTNIGTFRAYLVAYLKNHPQIRQDMTSLVRQLPVTERGLQIELYIFSADQVWANYEAIQADIFDHVLAVLPLFDLRAFQNPTGADVRALMRPDAR
jgi:miniconductance mechanosensitive channel